MKIHTFAPGESVSKNVIFPNQVHGTRIVEIRDGTEDLTATDGIWTRNFDLALGVLTADCAPICFWNKEKFGIVHVGWRGLVSGIVEEMNTFFVQSEVFVGPFFPQFEVQRDDCFRAIQKKFGDQFLKSPFRSPFAKGGKSPLPSLKKREAEGDFSEMIFFDFQSAIESLLPHARFDPRSTFYDATLASWRRDHTDARNATVIGNF